MSKILIAVPTFENIEPATFKAIYNLKIPGGVECDFDFIRGYDCARARNNILKKGLDGGYDSILMVDSDVIIPEETLEYFLEVPTELVIGTYPSKSNQSYAEVFKLGQGYRQKYTFAELEKVKSAHAIRIPVNGGGFGCALLKTSILDKIRKPYFEYVNYPNGDVLSEDLYFCSNIRNAAYPIYLDTRVVCKHIIKQAV